MPDIADTIDITQDLNGQSNDAVPMTGNDIPQGAQPPQVVEKPPADAGQAEKPAPSLRETLSDAFKGQEAPKADQPPETPPQPKIDAPELVKVGERWHRKDGSFASREEIDALQAAQAPAGQAPPVQLPGWTQQLTPLEQQQFTSLPAEIRAWLERTMEGVNTRGAQFDEYGMLEQVIGPRRQAWAADGVTPAMALNQLFALSDFAGRDPGEFVMWFADQHRIDLDALLDARDAANEGAQSIPQLTGLQQEIEQLRNTINGFTTNTAQQQQAQHVRLVTEFINEKDASGNVAHPYFNEVANDITNHVALIRQQQPYLAERDVLQAAYDFATYNNPTIRAAMQQAQAKALQENAAAEAARARQASGSLNGGPAGDTSQQPNNANRTLRDELKNAFAQANAGS